MEKVSSLLRNIFLLQEITARQDRRDIVSKESLLYSGLIARLRGYATHKLQDPADKQMLVSFQSTPTPYPM